MENKKENPNFSYLQNKGYDISNNQFQNLLAFLAILFNEDVHLLYKTSPDYICEKFYRYIGNVNNIKDTYDYKWGVHPILQKDFVNKYYQRWGSMLNWTLSEKLDVL